MNGFDAAILVIILGTGFLGFRIGLMRAAFLLGAFVLGTMAGAAISAIPSSIMVELVSNPNVRELLVFIAIFLPVFAVVNIIGSVAYKSVKSKPMKWVDCIIGSILGILIGGALSALVIVYLTKSPTSGSEKWLEGSSLVPTIKSAINPILREFLRKKTAEFAVVFDRYIHFS